MAPSSHRNGRLHGLRIGWHNSWTFLKRLGPAAAWRLRFPLPLPGSARPPLAISSVSICALASPLGAAPRRTEELLVADGLCPRIRELLPVSLWPQLLLGLDRDPLALISAALEARWRQGHPLDTLHLVAHGRCGAIQIGGRWLSRADLIAHAPRPTSGALAAAADRPLELRPCPGRRVCRAAVRTDRCRRLGQRPSPRRGALAAPPPRSGGRRLPPAPV